MIEIERVYQILNRINICIQFGNFDAAREYAILEMKNLEEEKNKNM